MSNFFLLYFSSKWTTWWSTCIISFYKIGWPAYLKFFVLLFFYRQHCVLFMSSGKFLNLWRCFYQQQKIYWMRRTMVMWFGWTREVLRKRERKGFTYSWWGHKLYVSLPGVLNHWWYLHDCPIECFFFF